MDKDEQRLFRQFSVFVGGCTLDAVEAIAAGDRTRPPVLDLLGSLLDKSLLRVAEGINGEPRFLMLETLRDFGLEKLEASGEPDVIRRRHAEFFLSLAEQAEATLERAEQIEWMHRIEQEHDNLRAALEWSRVSEGAEELCLHLAGSLGLFWEVRGYFSEGRERLSAVLLTAPRKVAQRHAPGCLRVPENLPIARATIPQRSRFPQRAWISAAKLGIGRAWHPP